MVERRVAQLRSEVRTDTPVHACSSNADQRRSVSVWYHCCYDNSHNHCFHCHYCCSTTALAFASTYEYAACTPAVLCSSWYCCILPLLPLPLLPLLPLLIMSMQDTTDSSTGGVPTYRYECTVALRPPPPPLPTLRRYMRHYISHLNSTSKSLRNRHRLLSLRLVCSR